MCEGVGKLWGADIPEEDRRATWGANLVRLLERPGPPGAGAGQATP
jgi:hypothetical protein